MLNTDGEDGGMDDIFPESNEEFGMQSLKCKIDLTSSINSDPELDKTKFSPECETGR